MDNNKRYESKSLNYVTSFLLTALTGVFLFQASDNRADSVGGLRRFLHRSPPDTPTLPSFRTPRLGSARNSPHPTLGHQAGRTTQPEAIVETNFHFNLWTLDLYYREQGH